MVNDLHFSNAVFGFGAGIFGMTARPEPEWTPVKVERMAVAPAVEQGVGMVLGLALAVALIAEMYLDVVYVFGAGRVLLGFAIALEACSRALGLRGSRRCSR